VNGTSCSQNLLLFQTSPDPLANGVRLQRHVPLDSPVPHPPELSGFICCAVKLKHVDELATIEKSPITRPIYLFKQ